MSNYILHQFGGLHKLWDTPPLPHKFVDFQIYAADFIFICLLWNL